MERLVSSVAIFVVAALLISCRHSPVAPPPAKDMRALKWKVDTITYLGSSQVDLTRIWASSAQDIYIVGHNESPLEGTMFHFDGRTWSTTGFHSSKGGPVVGPVELDDVYGFGSTDVWVAGQHIHSNPDPNGPFLDSTLIVHFNGVTWKEYSVSGGRTIASIWGNSANDIWASGINTVLHYDGSTWTKDSAYLPGDFIQLLSVRGSSSNDLLMIGFRYDVSTGIGIENYFLYEHRANGWNLIDSCRTGNEKYGALLGSVAGKLYSLNRGVWRWTGTSWQKLFANDWPLIGIAGVSEDNLFVCGESGELFHYNGVDWYQFPQITSNSTAWTGIWTNGTTVIVLGNDGSKTYVARGE